MALNYTATAYNYAETFENSNLLRSNCVIYCVTFRTCNLIGGGYQNLLWNEKIIACCDSRRVVILRKLRSTK